MAGPKQGHGIRNLSDPKFAKSCLQDFKEQKAHTEAHREGGVFIHA